MDFLTILGIVDSKQLDVLIYIIENTHPATGGPKQAVQMLNENLDVEIDDYVAVTWKSVADAINILGGVDLEVTKSEFRYINAFITETVKSTGIGSYQLKASGMQHLDGVQAVAYCRLRLMDNDFKRTERQQKVLQLVLEKAKHADFATLNNIIETVFPQTACVSSIGFTVLAIPDIHAGITIYADHFNGTGLSIHVKQDDYIRISIF